MSNHSSARPERGDVEAMLASCLRHLRAANYSPKTLSTYSDSINSSIAFLKEFSMLLGIAEIKQTHIGSFINAQLERCASATASVRYRALQSFFKFLAEERVIDETSMRNVRPPKVPDGRFPFFRRPNNAPCSNHAPVRTSKSVEIRRYSGSLSTAQRERHPKSVGRESRYRNARTARVRPSRMATPVKKNVPGQRFF